MSRRNRGGRHRRSVPPYWDNGAGPAIHHPPVAWPNDGAWIPYTRTDAEIADRRTNDGSNGGTTPQSYVNVSSGCTDETLPSVYHAFDAGAQTLFFRWRVQAAPHNYATGPNPGTYSATSPFSSALWTVFIDTNGDGYRDFAVHLNGSSGNPAEPIDRLAAIWSATKTQSIDYVNDSRIKLLAHNPTAFVDGPSQSNRLLNFQNLLAPTPNWPNGSNETVWDYGTTRATLLNTGCGEYFVDYQIPLAMLDATAHGGPQLTANTPMSLSFATANSLTNPLQKDVVVVGDYIADPTRTLPGGDLITPSGGSIPQPTVQSIAATGCNQTTLAATILDTIENDGTTSVASAAFYAYADTNANGQPDDGNSWTLAANASTSNNPVGAWTATWDSTALPKGPYLIGVQATDAQGHITYSYLTPSAVASDVGPTPPNYANATGVIVAAMSNTCGSAGPSVSKAVSPASIAAGQLVTFTVTIANPLASAITLDAIADALPAGFTYQDTTGGTLDPATNEPTNGAIGTVQWTFSPSVTIAGSSTATLIFTANASTIAGTYANTVTATTSYGTLTSTPAQIGVGAPALTIAKSANVAVASPGDPVVYTITYSNDSPVNVTNATITDALPLGLDFVSASNGGSYDNGTRTVTWTVGDIPSGSGPLTLTLSTTLTSPYPGGATIPLVNTADIDSDDTSSTAASHALYVNSPHATLSIQNHGSVTLIAQGGQVTYTIAYANIGSADAANVVITDPIPAGWTFVSATDGGSHVAGTVTWNVGTVTAGASGTVQVTLQAGTVGSYTGATPTTNTATMSATSLSPVSDPYTVGVSLSGSYCNTFYFRDTTADVGMDGTRRIATTTPVTAGDTGSTLSATSVDSGDTVELIRFYQDPANTSQVAFSGTLSSNIYIDRANGPGVDVTGTVYDHNPNTGANTQLGTTTASFTGSQKGLFGFTIPVSGTLQVGHRLLWVYTFASANTQSVTLHAEFGGTVTHPISGGTGTAIASSTFCTTAPALPVLDKQVDTLVAAAGDTLVYTIHFGNAGQTDMTSTEIVDTLPDGVTFTSATLNGAPITPTGGGQAKTFAVRSSDTGTDGQVTGGQSGTLVITAAISQPFTGTGDTLTNTVSMASAQTGAVADSISTTLLKPSVTIAKSASDTLLVPGDTVTYALDVLNAGPGAATDVTIADVLPATGYFTYVAGSAKLDSVTITPDPVSGGTLTANIGSLAAGATARVTFDMLVASGGVPDGTTPISNTATVSDAATTGTRSSNTLDVTVTTNPLLQITRTSAPASGPVAAGSTIVYTVTVTNVGSGSASNVLVTDLVPGNTTYVAGSLTDNSTPQTDAGDSDSATFDGSGNRIVFTLGTLASGVTRTLTFTVRVDAPLPSGTTTISGTATVSASNAATKTASSSIDAAGEPVLTLSKTAPATIAFPLTTLTADASNTTTITVADASRLGVGQVVSIGGTVATITMIDVSGNPVTLGTLVTASNGDPVVPTWEYVLEYQNTGTSQATGVVVSDDLPIGLDFVSASAGGGHCAGTVSWNLGTVAAGASGTLRVRVRPTAAGTFANSAMLSSIEVPTVTSNTTSTEVGSLTVTKSTTTPNAAVSGNGTTATYVIAVQNQNPAVAATNVTIADVLPPGFTYASTTSLTGATAATSPAPGDAQPTWTGLTIPANTTAILTFVANISNASAATYQNEVAVSASSLSVVDFDALSTTAEDVTIATVLGTTGVVTTDPTILGGTNLSITLTDQDLDTDPATPQTVQVIVVNSRTNETDTMTLAETGPATGVFSASLSTVETMAAGGSDNGPVHAADADILTVSYDDLLTGTGGTATVTSSTTVVASGSNQNPTAMADALTVAENSGLAFVDVLANDTTAPDTGETLTIDSVTQGDQGGSVVIANEGTAILYQPAPGFHGTETFTYTINDGRGGVATGTVTVTVTHVTPPPPTPNTSPSTQTDAYSVNQNATLTVPAPGVLANDSDVDHDALTAVLDVGPAHGTLVLNADGSFSYTPATGYSGNDGFSYRAHDGQDPSLSTAVTITVVAAPQPITWYPHAGRASGGVRITVRSSGFGPAVPAAATIGGVAALTVEVLDDATITMVTPPLPPGTALDLVIAIPGQTPRTLTAAYTPIADPAPDSTTDTDQDGLPDAWETRYGLDPLDPSDAAADADGDSRTNAAEYAAGEHPTAMFRRYFAEGLNHPQVSTLISVANAGVATAQVRLVFFRYDAISTVHEFTLAGLTRRGIDTKTLAGLAEAAFGVAVESNEAVAAERTMTWNFGGEGATLERAVAIPPRARLTIPVHLDEPALRSADLGAKITADRPIVAERSMYLDAPGRIWEAGTNGTGVPQPLTRWYFAEGASGRFFDAWILLANPNATDATADVRYLTSDGVNSVTTSHVVPAGRRITIRVIDDAPSLFDGSYSTVVTSTNDVPIIAERAMWWPNDGHGWTEGHVGSGIPAAGRLWATADGVSAADGSSESYVLIANISATDATVKATALFDDGTPAIERTITVGAARRETLRARDTFPEVVGKRFSIIVESIGATPADIVVDHSMYWNLPGVFWGAGTSAPGTRIR